MNTKIFKIFKGLFIFLMPILIITAFTGKFFDLGNLIYGIDSLDIVEQINEVKESAINFDNIKNIADLFERVFSLIAQVLELIFISPIRTIIDIYNLLFQHNANAPSITYGAFVRACILL